jgi:hypothetical protein
MDGRQLFRGGDAASIRISARAMIFSTGDVASPGPGTSSSGRGAPLLVKPFDLREVQRAVADLLARESARTPVMPAARARRPSPSARERPAAARTLGSPLRGPAAFPMKTVIIGTAAVTSIHGKSELVLALTGTHPDRLREERERGIYD